MPKTPTPRFTIKEKAENEYDSVIEMSNVAVTLTVNSVLDHLEYTRRQHKEAANQLHLNEALNTAVEEALPALKDIPEDKIAVVLQYFTRKVNNRQLAELIPVCEQTIGAYETRLKQIEEALGIKMPVPFDPASVAAAEDNKPA